MGKMKISQPELVARINASLATRPATKIHTRKIGNTKIRVVRKVSKTTSNSSISRYEKNPRPIQLWLLERWMEALGTTIGDALRDFPLNTCDCVIVNPFAEFANCQEVEA